MINFPKLPVVGYVIYDPDTNLFSTGGMGISWDKKAKIWMGLGPLANHLSQHIQKISDNYIKAGVYGGLTYKGHEQIFEIGERKFISTVEDKLSSMIERYIKQDIKKDMEYSRTAKEYAARELKTAQERFDALYNRI